MQLKPPLLEALLSPGIYALNLDIMNYIIFILTYGVDLTMRENIIKLPKEVHHIIQTLNTNGFEAYAVGGCIRDSLLGKKPTDWDITTNAKPEEIKSLFPKTIDTGIKHGTVTVVIDGKHYEVTTYRVEGKYENHRKPVSVEFTQSLLQDLGRRDFTINAIAYHPLEGIIDPYDGVGDILARTIKCVGNPDERLAEDALRMMRAVRFSSQLDFSIDKGTFDSIKRNSPLIRSISHERIRDELTLLLVSDFPMRFITLRDTGLLQYILPEFEICFQTPQNNPHHVYNVGVHTLHSIVNVKKDRILRWVMLLHDIGKPLTRTTDSDGIDHFYGHAEKSVVLAAIILKRLRFDNKSIDKIKRLIMHHDRDITPSFRSVRKALAAVGTDLFEDLLEVKRADAKAHNPKYVEERMEALDCIFDTYKKVMESRQCVSLKDLAINGHDLIALGISPGKRIGEILSKLFEIVLDNPEYNTREKLLEEAKKLL